MNSNGSPSTSAGPSTSFLDGDTEQIPIFSDSFLEHNRQREAELRQLRKVTMEFEEQNAMLSKHIENMNSAIERMQSEFILQRSSQGLSQQRLARLRTLLYQAFADVPMPGQGAGELPTPSTIDQYIQKLHSRMPNLAQPTREAIIGKIQNILTKLDL